MIIEIPQQLLHDIPMYLILGLSIFLGICGCMAFSIREYEISFICGIFFIGLMIISLILFGIIEIKIVQDITLSNSTGVIN